MAKLINLSLPSSYLKSHQPPLLSRIVPLLDSLKSHIPDFPFPFLFPYSFPGLTYSDLQIWARPRGQAGALILFPIYPPLWMMASNTMTVNNFYMWWLLNLYVQVVNPTFYYTSLVGYLIDISNWAQSIHIPICIPSQEPPSQ